MVGFALVSWRRKPKAAPLPERSIEARNFDASTFGDDDSAFNDSGPPRFTEPQDDSRDVILSAVNRSRIS